VKLKTVINSFQDNLTFKAPVTLTLELLYMTNQYVKYEDSVINSFQDNEWKPF
jgi:hypothetical protein